MLDLAPSCDLLEPPLFSRGQACTAEFGLPMDTVLRVLCVDDNRDAADSLSALLTIAGFTVHTCYSGHAAIAVLDEFCPEVCILDLMMPGMDGLELSRRIRAWSAGRHIPLVAVTALSDEAARRTTSQHGFDLHLTKPFDPDQLAALVVDIVILRGCS
ncbi:response regulator [Fimbriiglobus ruber]|nr:response regulator [Fimbriiglobus ruber]